MHGLCTVISYEVGLVVLLAQAHITTPPSTKLMVRNFHLIEDSVYFVRDVELAGTVDQFMVLLQGYLC